MGKNGKILILRAYRPFLSILTAYDVDNFRTNDQRILKHNILLVISVSALLFAYVFLFLPMELSTCIEHSFNLNVIGQQISFSLGGSQVLFIYGAFWWKRDKLIATFDYLHGIVEKRKKRL